MKVQHFSIGVLAVFGIFLSTYWFCEIVTENFEGKVEYYTAFYEKLVNGYGFATEERQVFNADVTNCILAISMFVASVSVLFGMAIVSNTIFLL